MKIAYIRWHDAHQIEAGEPDREVEHDLAELHEVGFFLGETDEVVSIGMEMGAEDVAPGRWRLNIPKVLIKEFHIKDLGKVFPLRNKEKAKKAPK